jgi:hypothetical protein
MTWSFQARTAFDQTTVRHETNYEPGLGEFQTWKNSRFGKFPDLEKFLELEDCGKEVSAVLSMRRTQSLSIAWNVGVREHRAGRG